MVKECIVIGLKLFINTCFIVYNTPFQLAFSVNRPTPVSAISERRENGGDKKDMSLVLPWTPGKEEGLTEARALFAGGAHATRLRSPAHTGWQGGKPSILLLPHKVLLWSQEGPRWPGVQNTAFIAGQSHDFKGRWAQTDTAMPTVAQWTRAGLETQRTCA